MMLRDLTTQDAHRMVQERLSVNLRATKTPVVPGEGGAVVGTSQEKHFIAVARRLMTMAQEHHPPKIGGNPFVGVKPRGFNAKHDTSDAAMIRATVTRRRRAMTVAQAMQIADHLPRFYRIHVMAMLCMPIRVGELTAIAVDWIDLDAWTLELRDPLKARPVGERRLIPIPAWPAFRAELTGHLAAIYGLHRRRADALHRRLADARTDEQRRLTGQWLAAHGERVRAFPTHTGAPFSGSNFNKRIWHDAVQAAAAAELSEGNAGQVNDLIGAPFAELRHAAINDAIDNARMTTQQVAENAGNSEATIAHNYIYPNPDREAHKRRLMDQRWARVDPAGVTLPRT